MDRTPHLAAVRCVATPGRGIVGAAKQHGLSRLVLLHAGAGDEIGIAQPHFAAGGETVESSRRVLHEVLPFDPDFAGERDFAAAGVRIVGVVPGREHLGLAFGPVLDHDLERAQHGEPAFGGVVERVADAVVEQRGIDEVVGARHADAPREVADRLRRHAAPAQPRQRRHPGIVPARDMPLLDQADKAPLRQHGMGEVEARELVLARARRHRQVVDQPVVERAVIGEFERAEGMRHPLDRVGLAMREIVGRVDAPGVAGARMAGLEYPVENRVAQVDVARGHVDPGAQHAGALVERARPHAAQEVEILGGRAVAAGARGSGFGQRPPHRADFVGARIVDIGLPFAHQMLGPFVEPLEMIGREVQMPAPVVAEPADVSLDGLDERGLFPDRVGVVEAEMAAPAELPGDPEIEHDRLGMADMEIAVGLGREAGHHLPGAPGRDVFPDYAPDEIAGRIVVGHPAFRSHSRHFSPAVDRKPALRTTPRLSPRTCSGVQARPGPRSGESRATAVPDSLDPGTSPG